jgi:hypothetical protein
MQMVKFLVKMQIKALSSGETVFYMMIYIKSIHQLISSVGNLAYYGLATGRNLLERMISCTYSPLQRIKTSQFWKHGIRIMWIYMIFLTCLCLSLPMRNSTYCRMN